MSLREDLLAIPGIAGADLDGDETTPGGVRIRLATGADPDAVGREVQRVLAAHGMRSHMTDKDAAEPEETAQAASDPLPVEDDRPAVAVSTREADVPPPPPGALRAAVGADVVQMPGLVREPEPADDEVDDTDEPVRDDELASVAVEETRTGVTVRVRTTHGREVARVVAAAGPMVDIAIVEALGELIATSPPQVVAVNDHVVDGTDVILVVVEHADGTRTAGAAVMEGGRPFAVGTAAWRAVSAPV